MRKKILFGFVVLFAVVIGLYPITYFIANITDESYLSTKSTLNNYYWVFGFKIHIISSGIALLIGWVQFNKRIKASIPIVHRLVGYVFFISVFIGGMSGLYLSFYSNYILSKIGFGILSTLWLSSSFYALYYIKGKQFDLHKNWALRTYSITFSSVTFRICFVLFTSTTNNYEISFSISSWLCWIINIIIIELIIQNSVMKPSSSLS